MLENRPTRKRWILKTAIWGAVVYTFLAFIGFICLVVDGTGKFYSVFVSLTLPLMGVISSFGFLNDKVLDWTIYISPAILGVFIFVGTRTVWNSIQCRSAHLAPQKNQ